MKRDDMNIDAILKQYLPRAPQEEVDEASETVLKRIRDMRFQDRQGESSFAQSVKGRLSAAEEAKNTATADRLHDFHVAVLMAVDELQGHGHLVNITLRMEQILEEPVVWDKAVFFILVLMERMGLVSASPIDPGKPEESDRRYFAITDSGRDLLAKALAVRQQAAERARGPLKGFA
jgi:DNA polymerase II large subunit